jgi:hypothetical protein
MDDGKAYGWMGSVDLSDSDWGTVTGVSARLMRTASACTVSSTLQIPSPLGPSPNVGSKVPDQFHCKSLRCIVWRPPCEMLFAPVPALLVSRFAPASVTASPGLLVSGSVLLRAPDQ